MSTATRWHCAPGWSTCTSESSRAERDLDGPLTFRLDVGLRDGVDPLWQRDLDNYLYPVARGLADRYVSAWATKSPGRRSSVRVAPALERESEDGEWSSFAVPRGARSDNAWKRSVGAAASGARELPTGPVALEIGFVVGTAARWPGLWKASIDGLETVLGRTYAEPAWNPQDGRIVRLGMHRTVCSGFGSDAAATVWARSAPLEWEENGWLRALTEREREAFLEGHAARVARSQQTARSATPERTPAATARARPPHASRRPKQPLVRVPGVVVFADDDAGYETWLRATPTGFVLNALRRPGSGTLLHRAICGSISGSPARGVTWTAGVYVKACATDPGALATWLEANGGKPYRACGMCLAV